MTDKETGQSGDSDTGANEELKKRLQEMGVMPSEDQAEFNQQMRSSAPGFWGRLVVLGLVLVVVLVGIKYWNDEQPLALKALDTPQEDASQKAPPIVESSAQPKEVVNSQTATDAQPAGQLAVTSESDSAPGDSAPDAALASTPEPAEVNSSGTQEADSVEAASQSADSTDPAAVSNPAEEELVAADPSGLEQGANNPSADNSVPTSSQQTDAEVATSGEANNANPITPDQVEQESVEQPVAPVTVTAGSHSPYPHMQRRMPMYPRRISGFGPYRAPPVAPKDGAATEAAPETSNHGDTLDATPGYRYAPGGYPRPVPHGFYPYPPPPPYWAAPAPYYR